MKKQVSTFLFVFTTLFCVILFLFSRQTRQSHTRTKPIIVCTTMMLKDVIDHLVFEEECVVFALMGPGVDPHTYRARPSDITTLLAADLIVYNGLHLEGKMGEILHDLQTKKTVVCATDTLSKDDLISSGYETIYDPHVWHDPFLWSLVVHFLAEKLMLIFPQYKEHIAQRYSLYQKKLESIKQDLENRIADIPIENRILITAHDAFQYFGKRYHFQVLGLQGLSTESEIGIKDMLDLATIIVEKKVTTVFPESCISTRNMVALQELVQKKGWKVALGEELFSDALSDKNGPAPDYLKMILYNATHITNAVSKRDMLS
jgi:manganese/zinc/iron transport system substrate-binding protein